MLKPGATFSAVLLLFRSHKGLWLGLLSIIITMILLFSYILLMRVEVTTDERSKHGLVATAEVSVGGDGFSLATAHQVAKQINAEHQVLVVPIHRSDALKCRFYTRTSYTKEVEVMIDGYEETVDKKFYEWVASGEFTLTLNQIDLSVSQPVFTLLDASLNAVDDYPVVEFAEDATKLALSLQNIKQLDESQHYYFAYEHAPHVVLGPLLYDKSIDLFMLLAEEDLNPEDVSLLADSEKALNQFIEAIYRQHLPFLPGAAIDQMQLEDYEYSLQQRQTHNKMMLNALLFDPSSTRNTEATVENPARTFFSQALFGKVFPNPFDYKTLQYQCHKGEQSVEQIASVYGHYRFKPLEGQNPNQIFVPFGAVEPGKQRVSGFLIKPLGNPKPAMRALENLLKQQDSRLELETSYVNQRLWSFSLFIIIIIGTAVAMIAILLVLTLPLRQILAQELFLIKLYGGKYLGVTMLCCLLLFIAAVLIAWGLGVLIMQYVNLTILAPYNVPFMRFNPMFFIGGCGCVLAIWLFVWGWLGRGLTKIVEQAGLTGS